MKFKILMLLGLLSSSAVHAETAVICESCGTESAAQSFAKSKANPLECSPIFDFEVSCQSQSKIVTFVDANSGQAYKYNVFHERHAPWNVQAERIALSSAQEQSFDVLMKFIRDWNSSVRNASTSAAQLLNSSSISPLSDVDFLQSSGGCPSDTALSALTNPNTLDEIKTTASLEIGLNLTSKNNDLNLNPVKINKNYSLTFMGIGSTITTEGTTRNPSFVVSFDESERASSRKDFLAYSVNILGYDTQNLPILEFSLSDSSQVAGYTLGGLKGNNGPLQIDNDCIEDRFETAVNQGVLTPQTTSTGGTGGGSNPDPIGSPGGTWSFPSGGCRIVEFFQGGSKLYTFRYCK